jgi:hypothetical protein
MSFRDPANFMLGKGRLRAYSKRTLEGDLVFLDIGDGGIGNGSLAVLEDRGNVDGLPGNRSL